MVCAGTGHAARGVRRCGAGGVEVRRPEAQHPAHGRAELGHRSGGGAGFARSLLRHRQHAGRGRGAPAGQRRAHHRGSGSKDRRAGPDDVALLPRPGRQPHRDRQLSPRPLAWTAMSASRFSSDVYAHRLRAAAAATADAGLAGLVVTPGYDLRYLVGSRAQTFERLTALVVPGSGEPTVVVPRLELASLKESAVPELGLPVRDWVDGDDPYRLVADALGGAPVATAVTDSMPALHLLPLADVLGVVPVPATDVLRPLRMIKDPAEIDALRKAGAAIDRVHARVPEFLVPGRTEADVAADIAEAIVAEGHSEVAFIIVGSGPHGADPHHECSDRELRAGDIVVVDIGGPYEPGYNSDSTRTYSIGEPDAEVARRYAVLQRAQQAAVEAVRPGVTAEQIDAV